MKLSKTLSAMLLGAGVAVLSSCGGGGGGPSNYNGDPTDILKYPYETVYGDVCKVTQPTPGCTFSRATGQRVTVSADTSYDSQGNGSNDMWYVKFDSSGNANVYDDLGNFQYTTTASQFAGYIGGTTIGVGTSGTYWENVANGTYWFGNAGVLYSANTGSYNYGQAINTKDAQNATDTNSKALVSEVNQQLIKAGADKLVKQYNLTSDKAIAVASALNSWAVMGAERGKVTSQDMDQTFQTVFGVKFNEALTAVNAYRTGSADAANQARDLTNRSAAQLGLKPDEAKAFIKSMYQGAMDENGVNSSDINW